MAVLQGRDHHERQVFGYTKDGLFDLFMEIEQDVERDAEEERRKKSRFSYIVKHFLLETLLPPVQYLFAIAVVFFLICVGHHLYELGIDAPFQVPFTDIYVRLPTSIEEIPLPPLFFEFGPFTLFISPLSLFPLPAYVPFRRSYLVVNFPGWTTSYDSFFISNLFPALYFYLPPLSSLSSSSLPPITVSLTAISFLPTTIPLEVFAVMLHIPLWSLLRGKIFDVRFGTALFPGGKARNLRQTFDNPHDTSFIPIQQHILDKFVIEPHTYLPLSEPMAGACLPLLSPF